MGKSLEIPTWAHFQSTNICDKVVVLQCVTETLDTCNKYYTFSRTNVAPSNLMDTLLFYSTHLLVPRTWLYFPWVLSGHHCNHCSGTICSKQPREPVIYQEQRWCFGEGHNCICVGVVLLSQMGHSVQFKASWGKEEQKQALQREITSNSQIYNKQIFFFLFYPFGFA